jgi:hypothetical protein
MYPAVPLVPTPKVQLNWRHFKSLKFPNFTLKMKILFNEISPFNVLLNVETGKKILLHGVVAQNCISLSSSKQSVRI